MSFLLVILLSYLLGSVPFGLVLTKCAGLGDIRAIGSGNIGATNVLRTGKKSLAFLTLLLDGGKGAVAVWLAATFAPGTEPFAGLAALLGHLFPVWLKFKGGKGVATSLGVLVVLAWPVGVTAMLCWLLVALVTRYSSLAALVSFAFASVAASLFRFTDLIWLTVAIAALILFKHIPNIQRLIKGTEPYIGQKEKEHATPPS